MKKIVPLQNYSREVQIMAHMIGLNNKRPYVRHGRRYYKPYRSYFCAALSGPDYEALRALERRGRLFLDDQRRTGLAGPQAQHPDP